MGESIQTCHVIYLVSVLKLSIYFRFEVLMLDVHKRDSCIEFWVNYKVSKHGCILLTFSLFYKKMFIQDYTICANYIAKVCTWIIIEQKNDPNSQ